MTESKFTPGPWVVNTTILEDGFPDSGIAIMGSDDTIVAEAWKMDLDEPSQDHVTMANARLIAAAPEMFAVITELIRRVDNMRACPPWGVMSGDEIGDILAGFVEYIDVHGRESIRSALGEK